ncbi:MAG: ATP-binding protein, partial [bacterium]
SSLLKKYFIGNGYRAQTALTADAARETFSKTVFDVVIIDYHLPNLPGDVLLQEFLHQRPDTVCIMITADTRPDLALDWTKNGAAACMQKPFKPEYLIEICDNARRQRALIRVPDLLEERTRQLQESEERFRNMADLLPEPIFETNLQGVLTFVNRQAYAMFGFTAKDFKKGLLALDMVAPDSRTHAANNMQRALSGEALGTNEYEAQRKDGSTFPVLISSVVVLSGDEPVGLRGVIVDISERKRTEQHIKAQSEELRKKNAELERFSYTISHDLNSPLITIKAFVKTLLKDMAVGRHDRLVAYLTRIGTAAESMGQLLTNLLLLSRVGRTVSQPIDVDMNNVVHGTLALLAGPIAEQKATIRVMPELPHVKGDRQRIAEVVQNLLENALKYMGGQTEPCIEIGVERVDPDSPQSTAQGSQPTVHSPQPTVHSPVFYVYDNGVGIEPQNLDRVFDLFDKLDPTTKGPGIGLSLVKRIVQAHGGRIWVESKGLGKGSAFKFTLPGA